jgi:hypothetical protein
VANAVDLLGDADLADPRYAQDAGFRKIRTLVGGFMAETQRQTDEFSGDCLLIWSLLPCSCL